MHGTVPRHYEVIAGIFLLVLILGFAIVGGLIAYMALQSDSANPSLFWLGVIFLFVGILLFPIVIKLIKGKGKDNRNVLFSPSTLRIGSLIFASGAIIAIFEGGLGVFHMLSSFAMAGACWGLASKRERYLESDFYIPKEYQENHKTKRDFKIENKHN